MESVAQGCFKVVLEGPCGVHTIACAASEYVWDAAARGGVRLPAICHQGRCLTCAARLLAGRVDQSDAAACFPADERARFILLCRAKPESDLRILTHQQSLMRAHRKRLGLPAPYG